MPDRIDELMQKRASVASAMGAILDRAEDESRSLTQDEATEYERMKTDLSELKARIDRLQD